MKLKSSELDAYIPRKEDGGYDLEASIIKFTREAEEFAAQNKDIDENFREKALNFIIDKLSQIDNLFDLMKEASSSVSDGRIKSTIEEGVVINQILKLNLAEQFSQMSILSAPDRYWYDVGNSDFPINIKMTDASSSNNASSKESVHYSLTGFSPEELSNDHWDTYFDALHSGLKSPAKDIEDKDYYYIVCDKKLRKIFWTSLRQLNKLGTPNGSNLPFQIPWAKNKIRVKRPWNEAVEFLMSNFAEGLVKSGTPLREYQKRSWSWSNSEEKSN